jgi:hypothetical protein
VKGDKEMDLRERDPALMEKRVEGSLDDKEGGVPVFPMYLYSFVLIIKGVCS